MYLCNFPQTGNFMCIHVIIDLRGIEINQIPPVYSDLPTMIEKLEKIQQFIDFMANPPLFFSNTLVGQMEYEQLKKYHIEVFEPKSNEKSFFLLIKQSYASAITSKVGLVKYITQYFDTILQDKGMVFVNSENHPWLLESSGINHSPDGFITHSGMFQSDSRSIVGEDGHIFRFDKPYDTLKVVTNFILNSIAPWVQILNHALKIFNVDIIEGQSYRGCGACGRVFWVSQKGDVFALKIVNREHLNYLRRESIALGNARGSALTVDLVQEYTEIPSGAAILLFPVGEPLPQVQMLFDHLWQLHEKNIVHGNPRFSNVIMHNGQLLWIDLIEMGEASSEQKIRYVEILTKSVINLKHEFLNENSMNIILKYAENSTKTGIDLIAKTVCVELMRI
ncbi:hypothetical protein THRCLA_21698 [Thraustotheca clavata]|uniref:Protein kinase domain-containing protein n=1 Tax=Thraustotheca clavata TaxID=74557 RepID=A0A1V9ZQU1_9STRA|nr:hypothetical protein THRCLA_21698 [Thraustotheca clavata]